MAEQEYDLMHKDDVVASLQLDDLSGAILKVTPSASPELLPLGGSQGADSLRKWWLRRAVPISQGNIAALLQQEGIPSTQRLLVRNLGLSLSDHYWIKPSGSELTWKDVSPFSNAFSSLSETASEHFYSPEAALQGDLIKKWVIVDDTRCLLKGNRALPPGQVHRQCKRAVRLYLRGLCVGDTGVYSGHRRCGFREER